MSNIRTASLDELEAMHSRGETFHDREPKETVELPEGFWDDAELVTRENKQSVHLRVDADVLAFFKSRGKGHLTRMTDVLRTYVEAQKKHRSHTP